MRDREKIVSDAKITDQQRKLIIEVLLDIRDLLAEMVRREYYKTI